MRACRYLNTKSNILYKPVFILFKQLHKLGCALVAMEFNWNTNIGPGLMLVIVVAPS